VRQWLERLISKTFGWHVDRSKLYAGVIIRQKLGLVHLVSSIIMFENVEEWRAGKSTVWGIEP